ncbi:hypothetical protein LCGC14_1411250 [marine sediment metagenome]|uniref:Uncharacterized protein n=1 Tax=marine sediment metagenome TaxID=412755 RepID=A0A0F9MVW2_9ZZZZ
MKVNELTKEKQHLLREFAIWQELKDNNYTWCNADIDLNCFLRHWFGISRARVKDLLTDSLELIADAEIDPAEEGL